jgi:tRNA U54 and U55 pseudouridine synthase Pus10
LKSKNRQIAVSFPNEVFEKIANKADEFGMTKAELIRQQLNFDFGQKREPRKKRVHKTADPQLLYHLNKIGNNLNQIAKHLNEGNTLGLQALVELSNIEQRLKGFLNDCND